MKVMRAIRVSSFGGPEVLRLLADVPVPSVSSGQVLVKIAAAGVNPVDTYIRSGTYARKPTLPYTPGSDGTGVVHSVGEGVKQVKDEKQEMTAAIAAGMQAGFLNPIVGQEYQLPHASEAHRDIIQGKGAKGKVVLVP